MYLHKHSTDSADRVLECLQTGKIVIIPTDTIYGFSGRVPDSEGLIHKIKGRDEGKPFIQLISNPLDLKKYTDDQVNPELLEYWPGAVTIIVNNKKGGTTAFRCPGDEWLRSIIQRLGKPIFSTSVNRAGEAPLHSISEIKTAFESKVELLVEDCEHPETKPSTIVNATGQKYQIVRQGSVLIEEHCLNSTS